MLPLIKACEMTVSNGVVFNIPQQQKIHSYSTKNSYIRITINYEYSEHFCFD